MNTEKVQRALMQLDCEVKIIHALLGELIAQSPEPERLLRRFREAIDSLAKNAPKDTDPEELVELKARAVLHDSSLSELIDATASLRAQPKGHRLG